jgi:hypothetical protein
MYRLYYFLWLLLLFSPLHLRAQETVLRGKVLDAATDALIPFATLGIAGKTGTVSNENGEFELHLPNDMRQDSLTVSSIGYYNQSYSLVDLQNPQAFNVRLQARAYFLTEVAILKARLSAEEIVQKAIDRIGQNYIDQAFMGDGFYREYFKENGQYAAFAEAALTVYDLNGYGRVANDETKKKEIVQLNEMRVSDICNKGNYVLYIDINYALRGNMLRNADYWQRYFKRGKYHTEYLQIDSITAADRDTVFCIGYKMRSNKYGTYEGRLFIRTKDYAVLRIELTAINSLRGREENGAPYKSKAIMTYREHQGKLYLNYLNASHEVSYRTNDAQTYNLVFFSELLINNVQTNRVQPPPPQAAMNEKSIFYQPRYRSYDPDFWTNYNLFEDSEANDSIIADLEQQRSLEIQYRANGKMKTQRYNSKGD